MTSKIPPAALPACLDKSFPISQCPSMVSRSERGGASASGPGNPLRLPARTGRSLPRQERPAHRHPGAAGTQGPAGPAGADGAQGPQGPAGAVDYAAVIQNQTATHQLASFDISGIAAVAGDLAAGTVVAAGLVRVGGSSTSCEAQNSGALRFDATMRELQACDGTSWNGVSMRTIARARARLSGRQHQGRLSSRSILVTKTRADTALRISWEGNAYAIPSTTRMSRSAASP